MKKFLLPCLLFLFSAIAIGQTVITDETINAGETYTMSAGTEYVLDGYVYVEEGATLIIEPGVVVRMSALPSSLADLTSALVITRGAKIMAEGTAEQPIIFTSDLDDLSISTELTARDNNTWGCLLYTSPSPRDQRGSRMPSSA